MTRLIKTFTLFSLFVSLLHGGEYADAFLLASQSAQVQAMAYSTVAKQIGTGHALNNPAGFALNRSNPMVSLVYQQFTGVSNNLGIEVIYPANETYVLGFTFVHSDVPDLFHRPNLSALTPIDRRDSVLTNSNAYDNPIEYREEGVILSLAREFNFEINLGWKFFKIPCRMPMGLSVKYIDKLLVDNHGLGSGFDLGSQIIMDLSGITRRLEHTEFALGLVVSDILNTPVYWTTEHQDAIKRGLVWGYALKQNFDKYSSQLILTTSTQTRYENVKQYGIEIRFKELIYLRGGHDGYAPSFGLGIGLKKFIIDYSFSQPELANMQKIGISYHF